MKVSRYSYNVEHSTLVVNIVSYKYKALFSIEVKLLTLKIYLLG